MDNTTKPAEIFSAFSQFWSSALPSAVSPPAGGAADESRGGSKAGASAFGPAAEYWLDAWQRSILFLDVLRQRGDTYLERTTEIAPNVLSFKASLVMDGRKLPRPVNYVLARITPPEGVATDPAKRPFIVFDPRAGHGPGIGGMKAQSEIGQALAAGHPCYFVGFLPKPEPGQTIEDVCAAEARFVREVAELHPQAEAKPCLIGNCQAGWQIAMTAAVDPAPVGALILAGAPLSYWAGVHGKNPLRYLGGLLGGTWLTALSGDLGAGIFDGASLVENFERMNPANTYWKKPYNVYSKIDTEAGRFLDFETWWGNPVLLNAGEMQWIADNLFVGNRLTSGEIRTSGGVKVDLRNIRAPIVVFCSWGDDITPPQQALGWITDLYATDAELAEGGQTIVYALHESIGHLGIFVSGKVATKEHDKFVNCLDAIELLPPGLFQAVITEVDGTVANRDLVEGRYLLRFEPRTLSDIRALGGNDAEDDRRFETVARVSEVNKALYRKFLSPAVRALSNEKTAEFLRKSERNRLRFSAFSSKNPLMQPISALAETVRSHRAPVRADNPFLAGERAFSEAMTASLEAFGKARDTLTENIFLSVYGAPLVQAIVGLDPSEIRPRQGIAHDLAHEAATARLRASLVEGLGHGDLLDAGLRALVYVYRGQSAIDERAFAALIKLRESQQPGARRSMAQLKDALRRQALIVRMDEEGAVAAIPKLLPASASDRTVAVDAIRKIVLAEGDVSEETARRLSRIEALFGQPSEALAVTAAPAPRLAAQ
ncbi:conserved hypothetical protein [Methylocella silvestris BL2]|uniref:3-hydroxyalkanoate synthetase n=1 Tax=Methylocella silvestris (strain DSM 15510 / CIP 108128 / LMG 27833 / NCIMB 13906 / BL2) TaxID=395965 RepID=B8ERT2_METSB|nr:DUF3141 domain-containing protein [Methylocella silvestris]ACK51630.1 conserved hypothetical protein [Methylocella silvestris BL2]